MKGLIDDSELSLAEGLSQLEVSDPHFAVKFLAFVPTRGGEVLREVILLL